MRQLLSCLLLVGCTNASSSPAGTGKADAVTKIVSDQSAKQAQTEASSVIGLLDQAGAHAIHCKSATGALEIAKGHNTEDTTGLVVTGDYSYGTDQIQEVFARGNLFMQWGEEGNYQLTIANYTWNLFNFDGSSKPELDPTASTAGSVISESETAESVVCSVR